MISWVVARVAFLALVSFLVGFIGLHAGGGPGTMDGGGAGVEVVDTAVAMSTASDGTVTVTHGFSLSNNDVLFTILFQADDSSATSVASTSGGTWTQLHFEQTSSGGDRAMGVMRRVVTDAGSEPATYVFDFVGTGADHRMAVVFQCRNVDTGTPEDTAVTSNSGDSDFTPTNVSITTVTNGAMVLIGHLDSVESGQYETKTFGAPTSWQLAESGQATSANNNSIHGQTAYKVQPTAGTVNPGVWTGTPDDSNSLASYYTVAVAVRPN